MEELKLAVAKGDVWLIHPSFENYLPFPKDQMNLVVAYDPNSPMAQEIRKALAELYPNCSCKLPEIDPSYKKSIPARLGGGRSAVIEKKDFDKKVIFGNTEVEGVKIKGPHVYGSPPCPLPHAPETFGDIPRAPETYPSYDKNGVEYIGFKDQALGVLVEHAKREVLMNGVAIFFKVPVNQAGLGTGSYSDVFYPGNYGFSSKRRLRQMGTAIFLLTGDDTSISDLTLNIPRGAGVEVGEYDVPLEEAQTILTNFQTLSNELNSDFETLFGETIYRGSGKILNVMHSSGMIHGPRQSHYMNYTVPTKEDKSLKVRDFESAMLVKDMTNIQALRYMGDDLCSLLSSARELYCLLLESFAKVRKMGCRPSGCDLEAIEGVLRKVEPADFLLRGYTGRELTLEDASEKYGEEGNMPLKVVEDVRRESLAEVREKFYEMGKEVLAEQCV